MTLNPFVLAGKAFYVPFKAAILAAWHAAKADAIAEIKADMPGDADFAEVATALAELRDGPAKAEEGKRGRRALAGV